MDQPLSTSEGLCIHWTTVSNWSFDPLLIWGLFPRGLGLVLFISFLSLSGQVVPAAGSSAGLGSVARRMAKYRDDFPSWRRFLYFPTLLWLNNSDFMLRLLTWIGMASAALVIYGGPYSHWALVSCYLCYLSLDLPVGLVFPWDCLLLESTFLALFLPETHALPLWTATAAPAPLLTWAYRLLFFRLMFGFGKQKFMGSRNRDWAYLRGFFIFQPLLSPVAWWANKLPLWMLKLGVVFMFFVEIPAPLFVFFPGVLSVIAAVTSALLMIGIQLTGNFGYFSLLTIVICIPLLDSVTPGQLALSELFVAGAPVLTHAVLALHTLCTAVVFLWNSWLAPSWTLWSLWYRLPRWFQPIIGFFRLTQPFRWLHPYGVFPPNNQPGVKMALLPEVSWDGERWHELHFKFAPNCETSRGHFVAPYHPRGDQAIVYDTFGLNGNSLLSGFMGPWDPYLYASVAPALEFCHKLTQSRGVKLAQAQVLAQHDTPPIAARITTVMLEPVTIAERKATGKLWKRTYVGPHVPTYQRDPGFYDDAFGEPELWHPEAIVWRRRSRLQELMQRSRAGRDDPMGLALWDGRLSPQDVECFWNELVPLVRSADRSRFDTLPATVHAVRARFDRKQRRRLERLLGRFTLILLARFEPLYFYKGKRAELRAQTYLHLWMLAQHIVAQGRDAYLAALGGDASGWNAQLAAMTNPEGLYFSSVFRFEEMCFEAQKLRLLNVMSYPHDLEQKRVIARKHRNPDAEDLTSGERFVVGIARTVSGFFCVMGDIRDGFVGPAFDQGFPEVLPTFEELDDGHIRLTQYGKVPEGVSLAPDLKSLPVDDARKGAVAAE